jgi:hypothetical protein
VEEQQPQNSQELMISGFISGKKVNTCDLLVPVMMLISAVMQSHSSLAAPENTEQ